MSHSKSLYHITFCPWKRMKVINEEHERELYKFIYDFSEKRGVKVWRIGGMPDHVHLLCSIPPKLAVADYMKLMKTESSKFMRANPHFPEWRGWAEKYSHVTVDYCTRQTRIDYIKNQKQHHARVSFDDEYRAFLRKYDFPEDTPLLGDDPV